MVNLGYYMTWDCINNPCHLNVSKSCYFLFYAYRFLRWWAFCTIEICSFGVKVSLAESHQMYPNVIFSVHFLSLPFILHSFPLMFLLYCIHLLSFCIRVLSFSLHVALIFHSCPSMFLLFAVPFILHLFPCIFLSFPFHFTFISFHVPSLCIKHTGLQKGIYSNR
jgi:hypothetical protein